MLALLTSTFTFVGDLRNKVLSLSFYSCLNRRSDFLIEYIFDLFFAEGTQLACFSAHFSDVFNLFPRVKGPGDGSSDYRDRRRTHMEEKLWIGCRYLPHLNLLCRACREFGKGAKDEFYLSQFFDERSQLIVE